MSRNSFIVKIDNPCSENWSKMAPVGNGRFCSHCTKAVIDFSSLSDDEIIKILSRNKGSLCGRFQQNQLNKELIEIKPSRSFNTFYKYLVSLLLLGISKNAFSFDKKSLLREKNVSIFPRNWNESIPLEKPTIDTTVNIINGRILDSSTHKPIVSASIMIKGLRIGTVTDSNGNFALKIPRQIINQNIIVQMSWIGYKTQDYTIYSGQTNYLNFYLSQDDSILTGDVVIVRKHKKHWWRFWKR